MEVAIFKDLHGLIESFVKKQSYEFDDFCTLWQEHHLQYLYTGQTNTVEVLQTTNAALNYCKRIVCHQLDDCSLNTKFRQIGGLYLMYAIYYKQPYKEYVKIVISLQPWKCIKNLIHSLSTIKEARPVCFVFSTLCRSRAFQLAASNFDKGLEKLVNYDQIFNNTIKISTENNQTSELNIVDELANIMPCILKLQKTCNKVQTEFVLKNNLDLRAFPKINQFSLINENLKNIEKILGNVFQNERKSRFVTEINTASNNQADVATTSTASNNQADVATTSTAKELLVEEDVGAKNVTATADNEIYNRRRLLKYKAFKAFPKTVGIETTSTESKETEKNEETLNTATQQDKDVLFVEPKSNFIKKSEKDAAVKKSFPKRLSTQSIFRQGIPEEAKMELEQTIIELPTKRKK